MSISSPSHSASATPQKSIDKGLKRLNDTFLSGKTRDLAWRKEQLKQLHKLVSENQTAIEEALRVDLGRGKMESVVHECIPALLEIEEALASVDKWAAPTKVGTPLGMMPGNSEIMHEPLGVSLIIGAYNYPLTLIFGPLAGAIVAGCCAVVKPSEASAACESLSARLIKQYCDPDAIMVVCGGIQETTHLLAQKWDKIFFTGSPRVGKIVAKAAAEHLTNVTLELGGKSPTLIDKSCTDLYLAAKRILWGKFSNAGQTCIAPDYALVHEERYDAFLDACKTIAAEFYGDEPSKSPDFSRIVNDFHAARLDKLLSTAVTKEKATIVLGGTSNVKERYIAPTVLTDLNIEKSVLMQEEIFGPILGVFKVPDLHHAPHIVRSTCDKPLAMYIFAKDRSLIDHLTTNISSGTVLVNDTNIHFANSCMPFGGVGQSGLGVAHGKASFEAFSQKRGVLRRDDHYYADVPQRYPPYSNFSIGIFYLNAKLPVMPYIGKWQARLGFAALAAACTAYMTGWLPVPSDSIKVFG